MERSFEHEGFSITARGEAVSQGRVQSAYDVTAVSDVAKRAMGGDHGAVVGSHGRRCVRPAGILFSERDGMELAARQAIDEVNLMMSGYCKFEEPVNFRRNNGSKVFMPNTKAGLDFLESLPLEQRVGINYDAALGSLHRAHATADTADLRQARRDLQVFVSQAPGF